MEYVLDVGLGTFLSPVQALGTGFCFAGGSKTGQQDCSYSKRTSCPPREQLALGLGAPAEDALIWDGRKTTPSAHGETRAVASPAGNPTCSTQACLCCDLERVQTGRILQADVLHRQQECSIAVPVIEQLPCSRFL